MLLVTLKQPFLFAAVSSGGRKGKVGASWW